MSRKRALGVLLWASVMMAGAGCGEPVDGRPPEPGAGAGASADPAASAGPAASGSAGPGGAVPAEWHTAGCDARRASREASVGATPMPGTPPELEAAMTRIEEAGRTRFADSYAGLEVDQRQVRTIVYRVPSAGFDAFLRETPPGVCVVVRPAAHPAGVLRALQERISVDMDHWAARGIEIRLVSARHDGAGVEVGVADVAQARTAFTARYGADAPILVVKQGRIVPLGTA
ncbi:MAG TPA: hypothetical protein VES42_21110 [Pilimelia sp.]|nr:hypothetical protein [Pilimelia sp.]